MSYLDAIRCPSCYKLLSRGYIGTGYMEIKCCKCGMFNNIGTLATGS